MPRRNWFILLLACFFLPLGLGPSHGRSEVDPDARRGDQARHLEVRGRLASELDRLARWSEEHGLGAEAEATRRLIPAPDQPMMSLRVLPSIVPAAGLRTAEAAETGAAEPGDHAAWQTRLRTIRERYAGELYRLAQAARQSGDLVLAYDVVREAVDLQPDYAPARKMLGYIRQGRGWVTPFAAAMLRKGNVWSKRFGWVPRGALPRYEAGLEIFHNQWMDAARVQELRRPWRNPWEIRTEHYLVKTDVSLEKGVELGRKLEGLYSIFFRLYSGFFPPEQQAALLLHQGRPGRKPPAVRLRVDYFADRQKYIDTLRPLVGGGVDISLGIYLPRTHTCYFFVHEQFDESTLFHEATHQLFGEIGPAAEFTRSAGNFWVVEGVACYMESLKFEGDRILVGALDGPRIRAARRRLIGQHEYIPLEDYVTLDKAQFDGGDVYLYYAQAAALTHFFLNGQGGAHRDAFVDYVAAVYAGSAGPSTLRDSIGVDYPTLDREVLEFLKDEPHG